MYAGYVPEGEGHSGNPGYSSAVSVVAPISGSLRFDFWCQKIVNGQPIGVRKEQYVITAGRLRISVSRVAERYLLAILLPKTIN